jgi:hydroxyacyl-ACP dehydratase HTD2-like protein with hotdog domain
MINFSSEIEFFDFLRVGDRLNVVEEVESISEEKQTKVGRGHFITVVARFRRQSGELVAEQRNVMLRFTAEGAK